MAVQPTREQAWELLCEYTKTDALRKHALAVEAVMRHFAKKLGENEEKWGVIGMLHDLDYEQYPDEHCVKVVEILKERDVDEDYIHAVVSHGWTLCSDVEPTHPMEKIMFATDEMTGLINAVAIMRPSKSLFDLKLKSVKKKYKTLNFAAGVNREIIEKGAEMCGYTVDELIVECIEAMKPVAEEIGLKGNLEQ